MDKIKAHTLVKLALEERISSLKNILSNSFAAVASEDTKSSAGDKHETAVSMAQLEQHFSRIQSNTLHSKVQLGSLILTDKGYFYVSVGLGKVEQGNNSIFALGVDAPLVKLLLRKTVGDVVEFNGSTTEIKQIN